jgi:hypothetical protein
MNLLPFDCDVLHISDVELRNVVLVGRTDGIKVNRRFSFLMP